MDRNEERIKALEEAVAELRKELALVKPNKSWRRSDGVTVGKSVRIHRTANIIGSNGKDVYIGDGVQLRRNAEIVGPATIGSGSSFNRDVYIRANVRIGKNCNVGAFCRFVSDSHEIGPATRRAGRGSFKPIVIGDGTWVGANSIILGGVTVGESCVIAAGSVVMKDVPPNTMVGGVPARHIKDLK